MDSLASRIHASFVLNFVGCTTPTILTALHNFAGHSRSQFLASILDGFLKFLFLRVDKIDPSQFSCVLEMELFFRPLLLLVQLGMLAHFVPEFWPACQLFSRQSLPGPHTSVWSFLFAVFLLCVLRARYDFLLDTKGLCINCLRLL